MAYDLSTIRTNLKTLLQTVTEISNVYDYFSADVVGYPAILFDIVNSESEMLTDTENLRTITFDIYILSEIKVEGIANAKRVLDVATKQVVTALEDKDNMSLSGSVDWLMPTEGAREQILLANGQAFSQKLSLQVKASSSIL